MMVLPRPLMPFHRAIASANVPSELKLLASALLREPRYATLLSAEILPVYADLRDIIIWQQINAFRKDSTVDPVELDLCATLLLRAEYRLAKFSYSNTFEEATSVQAICRVAIPMFVVQTQLFLWRDTATMRTLVGKLRGVMACAGQCGRCSKQGGPADGQRVDMEELWYGYPELFLWACLIGAFAAASDMTQRSWFLFHCAKGVNKYRDQFGMRLTWAYVDRMLTKLFYVASLHGNEFSKLWEEVMLLANFAQL